MKHQPVLLQEALKLLNVHPGELYIDATYGSGGHTEEILKQGGKVLALDVSPAAIERAERHPNLKLVQGNFSRLEEVANGEGFGQVGGVLFDFGVSSEELVEVIGLSWQRDEPLDMRLDPSLGVTAADLLNALPERGLDELFATYGEESFSRSLARRITQARELQKIETTAQLVRIVEEVKGRRGPNRIHPATKAFQALRIAVNDELGSVEVALPQAQSLLKQGGRLVTISFHSGEDRIVKSFLRHGEMKVLTEHPVVPTENEVAENPRSRSAKLRAAEKL